MLKREKKMSDPSDKYFPNGLPRLVYWYEEEDGIKYVPGKDGVMLPVLDDHWIVADTKKTFVVNYYYPSVVWDYGCGSPVEVRMVSDYHNSEEETLFAAHRIQRDLEKEGRYIPISHRT